MGIYHFTITFFIHFQCSKTCGLGTVSRRAYCSNSTHVLSDSNCNRKLRPSEMKACYAKSCPPTVRWAKEKWNPVIIQLLDEVLLDL